MELKGKISQIIGAVVDVTFPDGENLPDIYTALSVARPDGSAIILECQQDIGENTMRCIAMDSTDGLERGMEVLHARRRGHQWTPLQRHR